MRLSSPCSGRLRGLTNLCASTPKACHDCMWAGRQARSTINPKAVLYPPSSPPAPFSTSGWECRPRKVMVPTSRPAPWQETTAGTFASPRFTCPAVSTGRESSGWCYLPRIHPHAKGRQRHASRRSSPASNPSAYLDQGRPDRNQLGVVAVWDVGSINRKQIPARRRSLCFLHQLALVLRAACANSSRMRS